MEEEIHIGDNLAVVSGPNKGTFGPVYHVNRLAGQVWFRYTDTSLRQYDLQVPIASVTFEPHPKALQFSAARCYDVRHGDPVVVVRGESRGRKGTVSKVNLDDKTLTVNSVSNVLVSSFPDFFVLYSLLLSRPTLRCRSHFLPMRVK